MWSALRLSLICLGFALGLGLSGCTQFPELDATQTPGVADAAYPDLLPLGTFLNGRLPQVSGAAIASVQGRVMALRARADILQRANVSQQGNVDSRVARLRQKAAALRAQ
jgi:hypothetical protein